MSLLRKFFYKKPPEGLLEISERVFVFDCCFSTDVLAENEYKTYMGGIVSKLCDHFPDATFMVFNFKEGENQSQLEIILNDYEMTVVNYPRQYENCPVLTMEMIHHFVKSTESWLSIGMTNLLLMHCERGGWPVLSFMLAAYMIYRKQFVAEQKTLDMIYKQAPRELLHLMSPLNPLPSQLRYLQYVSRRKLDPVWPPVDRALTLDCVILRVIPNMDGKGGCRPIFRIYGRDPFILADRTPKVLFSTGKRSRTVRQHKQAACELVKIDIHCHILGDVVLECITLDDDLEREQMMFRVMFNTAFVRSNVLMVNRDEIDILWNVKDQFPKDFRAEILFSEMDSGSSNIKTPALPSAEDKGLPVEAFAKCQELFSDVDWLDPSIDENLNSLQNRAANSVQQKLETSSPMATGKETGRNIPEKVKSNIAGIEPYHGKVTDSMQWDNNGSTFRQLDNNEGNTCSSSLDEKTSRDPIHLSPAPPVVPPSIPVSSDIRTVSFPSSSNDAILASPAPSLPTQPTSCSNSDSIHNVASPSPPQSIPTPTGGGGPPPRLPPPPPPCLESKSIPNAAPPPPPPLRSMSITTSRSPPPPPPLRSMSITTSRNPPPPPPSRSVSIATSRGPPPPSAPHSGSALVPPPPPPSSRMGPNANNMSPPVPPPPSKANGVSSQSNSAVPPPPFGAKGKLPSRTSLRNPSQPKRTPLKPYHWLKLTRVMQGSLWAETQKPEESAQAPEFDMSELESLFSATVPDSARRNGGGKSGRAAGTKSDKVQLIDLRRAYNCEIMLTKVKIPLPDLMSSVLALDDSALDIDQVENLIKFCPTKEEMELLKNYKGEKENLGKCEQFFLELMKVPRVESKLRVFSFKIQFCYQVSDLRNNLNIVNSASEEIRGSVKLRRIMQTILSLGNALNQGTARGSAVGFRLDSLLKLTDTRSRNNKMTLMHYLCKVLGEKLPELLDFPQDLKSIEAATKIQLKFLAEEMQAISKGLEKVVQELAASENDGPVSEYFCINLKLFLKYAEKEVKSVSSLYSEVGRNCDALPIYFGEDPARCPFEQAVSTLLNFVRMFKKAHEENCKQLEFERKKALKEAENEKAQLSAVGMECFR